MGLFSFLKNVGANVLGKSRPESAANPAEARREKIRKLEDIVKGLELDIENLSIDLKDETLTVYGQTNSQSEKEKVILALGNVEGISTVDDRISVLVEEPVSKFYEVQSGDTLSKIAKSFYGDPMKYPEIFEANKPMLKDPDKIYPGQVLRIPPMDGSNVA